MITVCKGRTREVQTIQGIKDFANECGYFQYVVLQGGNKVNPSNIDFNFSGITEILPWDKLAGSLQLDSGLFFKFKEREVKIEGKRVIIELTDEHEEEPEELPFEEDEVEGWR